MWTLRVIKYSHNSSAFLVSHSVTPPQIYACVTFLFIRWDLFKLGTDSFLCKWIIFRHFLLILYIVQVFKWFILLFVSLLLEGRGNSKSTQIGHSVSGLPNVFFSPRQMSPRIEIRIQTWSHSCSGSPSNTSYSDERDVILPLRAIDSSIIPKLNNF